MHVYIYRVLLEVRNDVALAGPHSGGVPVLLSIMYIYICISPSLSLSKYICIYVYMRIYIYIYIYIYVIWSEYGADGRLLLGRSHRLGRETSTSQNLAERVDYRIHYVLCHVW